MAYTINAADGSGEIHDAVTDIGADEPVEVEGDGEYEWREQIEVPNGGTLTISNDVTVTVPSNHNISPQSPDGATVYSLITNADRADAEDVTIRGGEFDLSAMPETAEYAGVWLHDVTDGLIDDIVCRGSGQAVFGSSSNRGFNLALTRCQDSEIRDSAGYDAAYDDIAVRGGCRDCDVVRSGGSGASSGTIQIARWGKWGLYDYARGTTFTDCWGRRIYDHDGVDTTWDGCQSDYRLQTIGTDNPVFKNSDGFEGTVLLYTYDSGSSQSTIRNMDFAPDGREYAIRMGPNGPDFGTVTIDGVTGQRPTLLRLSSYSNGGDIDTITIRNARFSGDGTGPIISHEGGAPSPGTLRVENCVFANFDGIVGSYDTVEVTDSAFHSAGDPSDITATNLNTSNVTVTERPRLPGEGTKYPFDVWHVYDAMGRLVQPLRNIQEDFKNT